MIRIGVLGGYRGTSMINYCVAAGNRAKVVAICDNNPEVIERQKKALEGVDVAFYDNFEAFIQHDMDAVVLANFANEHAPFAIRCLNRGLSVYSEVLPCQTLAEAVELCEAVERSGKIYAYGENYCFIPAVMKMRELYRAGKIGEIEYAEGEYIHNCDAIWPSIAYGDPEHWRNNMYATFYCTHSLGPLIHVSGLRPVSVTGFEGKMVGRTRGHGSKSGAFGLLMVSLENGAIFKSIHGGLYKNSVWYSVYGSKGEMETVREATGGEERLYVNADEYPGEYPKEEHREVIDPVVKNGVVEHFGHFGSDYYIMDEFVKAVSGEADANIINVYEALDMFLPGLFGYRSILAGGVPVEVPDFRDPAVREKYRFDRACTDRKVAGDQWIPPFSEGEPVIPEEVYVRQRQIWDKEKNGGSYVTAVMKQGSLKK
ncbi:MAG: Gfo/Idh/MocA family oxidoreductase [Eubacteriales bacterium]|nr:Gfo/Idh/MocA family oxidoreductase [Eubacteriales bacterium]